MNRVLRRALESDLAEARRERDELSESLSVVTSNGVRELGRAERLQRDLDEARAALAASEAVVGRLRTEVNALRRLRDAVGNVWDWADIPEEVMSAQGDAWRALSDSTPSEGSGEGE